MKDKWIDWCLNKGVWEYITPDVWNGEFDIKVEKEYRISIVTTCMDRLCDLERTLLKNIKDNKDYKNLEFVIVDYNSSDGLGDWIKENYMEMIQKGRMVYVRTEEPQYYSMAHSRNIGFKVATGDVVNSVDSDNLINEGFADYINRLANQQPRKAIFAKGKRMMRGRLGFFKDEFINVLGGYSEDLGDYGSEDHDIVHRAWGLGFKMMWYGGKYCTLIESKKHQTVNYLSKDWKYTEKRNKIISLLNIAWGRFTANRKLHWGKARLVKNFSEELEI